MVHVDRAGDQRGLASPTDTFPARRRQRKPRPRRRLEDGGPRGAVHHAPAAPELDGVRRLHPGQHGCRGARAAEDVALLVDADGVDPRQREAGASCLHIGGRTAEEDLAVRGVRCHAGEQDGVDASAMAGPRPGRCVVLADDDHADARVPLVHPVQLVMEHDVLWVRALWTNTTSAGWPSSTSVRAADISGVIPLPAVRYSRLAHGCATGVKTPTGPETSRRSPGRRWSCNQFETGPPGTRLTVMVRLSGRVGGEDNE